MNELINYFNSNQSNLIHKWTHYFEIYDFYFNKFINKEIYFVEIGVFDGGSLKMWKKYFGPEANIIGIDINPLSKALEDDQIKIIIGDQEDEKFLDSITSIIPKIDILLDDGGHLNTQQINTFKKLYPNINENGIYVCEDIHTSYRHNYNKGFLSKRKYHPINPIRLLKILQEQYYTVKNKLMINSPKLYNNEYLSFIEFSKQLIDLINAWYYKNDIELNDKSDENNYTKTINSIHYYPSMLVVEKKSVDRPSTITSGEVTLLKDELDKNVINALHSERRKI